MQDLSLKTSDYRLSIPPGAKQIVALKLDADGKITTDAPQLKDIPVNPAEANAYLKVSVVKDTSNDDLNFVVETVAQLPTDNKKISFVNRKGKVIPVGINFSYNITKEKLEAGGIGIILVEQIFGDDSEFSSFSPFSFSGKMDTTSHQTPALYFWMKDDSELLNIAVETGTMGLMQMYHEVQLSTPAPEE